MQNAFWQSGNNSRRFLSKKNFTKTLVALEPHPRPPSWQMPLKISIFLGTLPLLRAQLQNSGFPFLFTNANSRLFPQYDLISSLTMFSNFCLGSGMFLRIPTLLPWWPKFPPPPPPDHNADFLPDFLHFYFLFHICPIFTLHQSQRSAKITIAVKDSTWSGQHGLKMLCKTTK